MGRSKFAQLLIELEYDILEKIANSDYRKLNQALMRVNKEKNILQGNNWPRGSKILGQRGCSGCSSSDRILKPQAYVSLSYISNQIQQKVGNGFRVFTWWTMMQLQRNWK